MDKREKRKLEKEERNKRFRRSSPWQTVAYPLGSAAGNLFMFLMMFVSYFAAGPIGLGTVIASLVITGSRVFDAITDPIVALVIDKTKGKYGKVRPFVVLAWLLMALSTGLLFFTANLVPEGFRLVYFVLLYMVYIAGYTFHGVAYNVGYALLTNDPKQRPVIGGIQMVFTLIIMTGFGMYQSMVLVPKYGGFNNPELFHEFAILAIIASAILYSFQILAVWKVDRIDKLGLVDSKTKITFKDYWPILKENRPLQMFVIAGATDKLSLQIAGNSIVTVMLFGIIIGDYQLSAILQGINLLPTILIILLGTFIGGKLGTKKGYIISLWGCIISHIMLFLLLWLGDPTEIRLQNMGFMTIAFLILAIGTQSIGRMSNALFFPMIPDIIDYETHRSGRFVPGIISAIYGLVDKTISSLAQTFVGLVLAFIGFKTAFPDVDTPYSDSIFWVTMFLAYGTLIIGWVASLIAMKYYKLDKDYMEKIQEELEARRQENLDQEDNDSIVNV